MDYRAVAFVLDKWLPHHLLEPGVSRSYAGQIRKHLMPRKMR
jgi:hypothetical protein